MLESLPSDFLTEMWKAFLTFSWKRTPIFAVSFGSCYCRQGSAKKKGSTQFIRGSPAHKLRVSLLWSGERVFFFWSYMVKGLQKRIQCF